MDVTYGLFMSSKEIMMLVLIPAILTSNWLTIILALALFMIPAI